LKYPRHVKKLILLSAIGMKNTSAALKEQTLGDQEEEEKENPSTQDFPLTTRLMLKFVWKQKISPYDVCRVCGERFMKKIIFEYLETRVKDEYERQIVGAYTF
jgi:hypothetical protein